MPNEIQPSNSPIFVPASLLRIRRFLNTQGKMKVKPWATVDETLDAFYDALLANRGNESFWRDIRSLTAVLSADMTLRLNARQGEVIENEVLDCQRQTRLLDEIRNALTEQNRGRGGFRRLAVALSAPAFCLLAILGGVITQGCYYSNVERDDVDASSGQVADTGAKDALQTNRDSRTTEPNDVDASIGRVTDTGAGDALQTNRDSGIDTGVESHDAFVDASEACANKDDTIVEMVNSCIINDERLRNEMLVCLNSLNDSWRTGLQELFQCKDCSTIVDQLSQNLVSGKTMYGCCGASYCANPPDAGNFDVNKFLDNCCAPIYIGVRFE